jgi:putative ABC transport system permease protein
VRAAAREVAPEYPMFDLGTMRSVVESSIAQPKLQTVVLVTFAGASLALAAIGIAGLLAFLVASRTPELALRLALGASARNVTGLVLSRGGALCAMGLAAGAIVSIALIGKFRAGVADSSLTQALVVAVSVLAIVAFIACWLPARRVTRIDPSLALRGE